MFIPKQDKRKFEIIEETTDEFKIKLRNAIYRTPLILNETSKYILHLINGKNSISDIEKKLIKKYKNVAQDKISADIMKTLLLFYNLRIIYWVNNNPYFDRLSCSNGNFLFYNVHDFEELVLGDDDFYSPYKERNAEFDRELLEYLNMNGQIHFFAIKVKDNKIFECGVVPNYVEKTLEITYIHMKENEYINQINNFFDWIIEIISIHYFKNNESNTSGQLLIYRTDKSRIITKENLLNFSFTYAGTLKKEFTYGDADIFIRSKKK